MIRILILLSIATMTYLNSNAQMPAYIKSVPNQVVEVKGNLSEGAIMEDLSWAWSSQNACFVSIRQNRFTGNHVLYYTDIPRYSEMEVTVIPDDESANFSIYAYEVGRVSSDNIVPNLARCIRCEADFKWEYPRRGKTQDHKRTASNLVAINNPYQVVIGVVGADGLQEGGYTLQIDLKSR